MQNRSFVYWQPWTDFSRSSLNSLLSLLQFSLKNCGRKSLLSFGWSFKSQQFGNNSKSEITAIIMVSPFAMDVNFKGLREGEVHIKEAKTGMTIMSADSAGDSYFTAKDGVFVQIRSETKCCAGCVIVIVEPMFERQDSKHVVTHAKGFQVNSFSSNFDYHVKLIQFINIY